MLSDSLRGKVAIVTGAASGIGAALAEHLVSKGWCVALCDVQDDKGRELATSLGHSAAYYHCDIASYDSQSAVFSSIWQKYGRIDALIANAAFSDRNALFQLRLRANGLPSIEDIPPSPDTTCGWQASPARHVG
ncbi:15-hydroxyprostaglandin dehydrogenase (nad(+)) [Colletotrichum truncatum]|uniref:15-hydroxyprostaglandin dehydrogenase (Nad(+)) n=1 Tax=Colletotrichum truncatum TaxID=5467 RepID=A0ACC3Z3D3_COLTU|nr:15-hydroxyprostaglandin dehydrogenase (nad(+)) [Colletotrichum truncatum]KAF6793102.1 15-hydroxyprostaglandin dehydrogenase (nad(+)) [Colletotrichum truncatum]